MSPSLASFRLASKGKLDPEARGRRSGGITELTRRYPKAIPVFISPENFAAFSTDPSGFLDKVAR